MNSPPDLPGLSSSGWSRKERLTLLMLTLLLIGLFVLRAEFRRQDGARVPLKADVVLVHVAGLRGDALAADEIAGDMGLDGERVLFWTNAFAPSGDARRSLLSLLRGDLVLNLEHPPGSSSLAARFGLAGWRTGLVGEGDIPERAGEEFQDVKLASSLADVPTLVEELVAKTSSEPLLLVVHLGSSGAPLHSSTTDSVLLETAYGARIEKLRGALARIGQAVSGRDRPQLVAVVGGSGLELGGHPEAPDRPWDDHLRVPMVLGLQHGSGLPWGHQGAMVQTPDMALTLLDLMDLRTAAERRADGIDRTSRSLEPLIHGWANPPVHERLFFADIGHAAVRTKDWKLISPVLAPWQLRDGSAMLFALADDPGEQHDLVSDRGLGPASKDLLARLRLQLSRPETLGAGYAPEAGTLGSRRELEDGREPNP